MDLDVRIISSFHDYYDTAQGHFLDPALLYRRQVETVDFRPWRWDSRVSKVLAAHPGDYRFKTHLGVVGFCGRIYPVWLDDRLPLTEEALSSHDKLVYR